MKVQVQIALDQPEQSVAGPYRAMQAAGVTLKNEVEALPVSEAFRRRLTAAIEEYCVSHGCYQIAKTTVETMAWLSRDPAEPASGRSGRLTDAGHATEPAARQVLADATAALNLTPFQAMALKAAIDSVVKAALSDRTRRGTPNALH